MHVARRTGRDPAGEPLADAIERIAQLGYEWGVSDGN
jgi:hypothetical protein